MNKFTVHQGLVVPLDRENVDTDAIIPKQFLKSIKKTGFGQNLFDEWRYLDHGEPGQDCSNRPINPDFVLNQSRYKDASILLARQNFGCGSSREHAPWALLDFGIRCIVAESFADIFYNNCFKNGILPIVLPENQVKELSEAAKKNKEIEIDLIDQKIHKGDNRPFDFEIESFRKECLLNGYDDIALTLKKDAKINIFEQNKKNLTPWLY